jgi:hypothetical protein
MLSLTKLRQMSTHCQGFLSEKIPKSIRRFGNAPARVVQHYGDWLSRDKLPLGLAFIFDEKQDTNTQQVGSAQQSERGAKANGIHEVARDENPERLREEA